MREYLIESEIKSVRGGSRLTQVSSRALIIPGCMAMIYSFRLKLVVESASAVLFKEVKLGFDWSLGAPIEKASEGFVDTTQRAAAVSTAEVENFIFKDLL